MFVDYLAYFAVTWGLRALAHWRRHDRFDDLAQHSRHSFSRRGIGDFHVIRSRAVRRISGDGQLPSSAAPLAGGAGNGGLALLLSVVLWNTSGWDNAGCCAGEVGEPNRTYRAP